jgi:hypothetical protein
MKGKIFSVFLQYILPILGIPMIFLIDYFIDFYFGNLTIIFIYLLINYYIVKLFLFLSKSNYDKSSLFEWLDSLSEEENLLKKDLIEKQKESTLENLQFVYKKLLVYTNHDKKKLKLLRGYYKTITEDGPVELLNKTLLSIVLAVIIWILNKGVLWGISSANEVNIVTINTTFYSVLTFLTYLFEILMFLTVFIKEIFKSKRRNKIVLEILEVCIDEL